METIKKALCIARVDAPLVVMRACQLTMAPLPHSLYGTPTTLEDRATCEYDKRLLQLLPYLTLVNERGQVYLYERGSKGGESKLFSKLSIGGGGHMERAVAQNADALHAAVIEGAMLEIEEEFGYTMSQPPRFTHVIYDPTTEPEDIHLGLWGLAHVQSHQIKDNEEGIIEKGQWIDGQELRKMEYFRRLEAWSKAVVDTMFGPPL